MNRHEPDALHLQQPKHAERRVFKAAGKQIGVRRLDTLACVL